MNKITTLKNGPILIEGDAQLHNSKGKLIKKIKREKIYLCRCGKSKNKPFCDGSHTKSGFRAD